MSTYKVIKENKYVTIHNEFFEIPTLSFGAKGLLGYIISKPADWKIQRTDLIKKSTGGKEQIDGYLLELMAHGFMNWYALKDEEGKIIEWVYEVYEMPYLNPNKDACIEEGQRRIFNKKEKNKAKNAKKKPQSDNPPMDKKPQSGYPVQDNPVQDNPPFTNKENTKKEYTKKEFVNNNALTKNDLLDIINSFYEKFSIGRWNKETWENQIANRVLNELLEMNDLDSIENLHGYIHNWLVKICNRHDINHDKIETEYKQALKNSPIPDFDYTK